MSSSKYCPRLQYIDKTQNLFSSINSVSLLHFRQVGIYVLQY